LVSYPSLIPAGLPALVNLNVHSSASVSFRCSTLIVQGNDVGASGGPNGRVVARNEAQVLVMADDAHLGKSSGHELRRAVCRAVVHQNDLEVRVGLRLQRFQAPFQVRAAVPGSDDN